MNKKYINNLETDKIELHFTKQEYLNLSNDLKKELKSAYLFSRYVQAWVSRSRNDHYFALQVAEKLGFTEEEKKGKRLSYEEELNRKAERAKHKIERYENYSQNAERKAENLQSDFNKMREDVAFITQPNINSAGGRNFTNCKNKIMDRYDKGFEEYRKSEYFQEKAKTAQKTADKEQLKDRSYLSNRIKECNKAIKIIEKDITFYEDLIHKKENNIEITNAFYKDKTIEQIQKYLTEQTEKLEYQGDKKAFMQNHLDKLGGICSKKDIKIGYSILTKMGWMKVEKVNTKTIIAKYINNKENSGIIGMVGKIEYSEIKQIKIPKNFKEKEELKNPYRVNDILVGYNAGGSRIIKAFQVLKTTPKTVQLQKININIENNTPIKDNFTSDKPCRKKIIKSSYSNFVGCYDDDWQLYLYKEESNKSVAI